MIAVSLKNVTLLDKGKEILSNIDLDLFEGEQLTLYGNYLSDLLLAMIAGVISPSYGTIEIYGYKLQKNLRYVSSIIGYLPPKPYVPKSLKLKEYLELSCNRSGIKGANKKMQIETVLKKLNLSNLSETLLGRLSESELKVAALAYIFVGGYKIFVLSRPFENLSYNYHELVYSYLREASESGITCILSASSFDHLKETDKVAFIVNNKIIAQGIINELIKVVIDEYYLAIRPLDLKITIEKLSKFPTIKKLGFSRDGVIKIWLKDFKNDLATTIELLYSLNLGIQQMSIERLGMNEVMRQLYSKLVGEMHD